MQYMRYAEDNIRKWFDECLPLEKKKPKKSGTFSYLAGHPEKFWEWFGEFDTIIRDRIRNELISRMIFGLMIDMGVHEECIRRIFHDVAVMVSAFCEPLKRD